MRIEVEAWYVALANAPAPTDAELEELSDDERARLSSYLVAAPARIFSVTRLALRRLLASRMGCRVADLRLDVGASGKPFLIDAPHLFFNVSHCPTGALIALCDAVPVGIDIENRAASAFDPHIAAAVCTPRELSWFLDHPACRDDAFVRWWSRKEAIMKAWGDGLSQRMSMIDIDATAAASGLVLFPERERAMWLDLALPLAEVGAVAVASVDVTSIDVTLRPRIR